MSHGALLSARGVIALAALDAEVATRARQGNCPYCGAALHWADYPRKLRGVPEGVPEHLVSRRKSLCCSNRDCRRRLTPPSVLFFDRRVYLSLFVTLAAVLVNRATPRRVREVARVYDVDRHTLERWRTWWTRTLPASDSWTELRTHLHEPVDVAGLPGSLLVRFTAADADERHARFLQFLCELSHSVLMRARFAMSRLATGAARRRRLNPAT